MTFLLSFASISYAHALAARHHGPMQEIEKIQCILQDIGSFIATPPSSAREAHQGNIAMISRLIVGHQVGHMDWCFSVVQ